MTSLVPHHMLRPSQQTKETPCLLTTPLTTSPMILVIWSVLNQ